MKPRVFLSHSKADSQFIERLASDLRAARIDVWYDEWEIPSGVSFRKRIFEEGISESDLFFVYLTPTSAASYWVERELDAAFVLDAEAKGGTLALFVDEEATRQKLSVDLRSLHCPVLNEKDYNRSFSHLIGRAWEAAVARRIRVAREEARAEVLTLQKTVAELQAQIVRLENASSVGVQPTLERLRATTFKVKGFEGREFTLDQLFAQLAASLAVGTTRSHVNVRLKKIMVPEIETKWDSPLYDLTGHQTSDILGALIIGRLVRVNPPVGDYDETYYLTELGALVAEQSTFGVGS